jgi:pyridoxal phosphate-dependent aminotransferase EpsN
MHLQPLFAGAEYHPHGEDGESVSDRLFESGVCLPSGSNLTAPQLGRVLEVLRRLFSTSGLPS